MNLQAIWTIGLGSLFASVLIIGFYFLFIVAIPRTVPFVFFSLCLILIGGSRLTIRAVISHPRWYKKNAVLIYGAGSAGRQLSTALSHGAEYHAVAFVDDDSALQRSVIEGIHVYAPEAISSLIKSKNIEKILLVMPSALRVRRKEVLSKIDSLGVQILTIPGMAELVLQALAKTQNSTRFCMVRFGNILGSSGSVVPLVRKQIRAGGPLTLTHPDITRYFMTIPEAAQLVIQAGAMGKGGDVFVLDMGDAVKIYDLARKIIQLGGFSVKDAQAPDGDIEIKCTGLRPGKKLYEEFLIGDNVEGTNHERIMTANEGMLDWHDLEIVLAKLDDACYAFDHELIRDILFKAPTGFNPTDGICDLVWQQKNSTSQKIADIIELKVAN